jgi:uncharacterized protein (TIGR02118 family)
VVKFVVLYTRPSDVAAFEKHYREVHVPLVKKIPGLRKVEICHFTGAARGEARYYMMAELYFDSKEAMMASLASPEGVATGKDVLSFAKDIIHAMFADVTDY